MNPCVYTGPPVSLSSRELFSNGVVHMLCTDTTWEITVDSWDYWVNNYAGLVRDVSGNDASGRAVALLRPVALL